MSETSRASASETGFFRLRAGPEDQHPGEPAARQQGHEHALLRPRRGLQELALGEQPPRLRPRGAGGLGRERAQPSPLADGEALEALEAAVPEEEGRVARLERPGQVLRQQPRERRQVGRLEDPLGETAEDRAAGGESEGGHGALV